MSLEAGFRIGEVEVHPSSGVIRGPRGETRVEPKSMSVLVELARHAPEIRSRDQIVAAVWPRGFVTDDVLTRCIGQLRRALEADPRNPSCLQTIPKRGYCLRHEVQRLCGPTPRSPIVASGMPSLIVLPFQNLSPQPEDYIADGVTELLISRLAALSRLRVISRTTSMQFKGRPTGLAEIAAQTGADWVVEGSVLQSGERLQVVAQLIGARNDEHVWAADYVRDYGDLLALQNEIASRVATAIRLQLGATEASPPPAPSLPAQAMRDYLKAKQLMSRRTLAALDSARSLLESVTSTVPDYASGWASLAEIEMLLAHYGAPDSGRMLEQCEAHIARALTLDPDQAIGLAVRGVVRFFFRRDLEGAEADLWRALSLLPSYPVAMLSLGNVAAVRRRFEDATAWLEQALLVDPLDVGLNMNMGDHRILQRRYEAAMAALRRAIELVPGHRPSSLRLCWALALAGKHEQASELLEQVGRDGQDAQWHEYAALVGGLRGDRRVAVHHYDQLIQATAAHRISSWSLARAATAAGKAQAAFEWLERAVADRSSSLPFLMVTPAFDPLRLDPRFAKLATGLGFARHE